MQLHPDGWNGTFGFESVEGVLCESLTDKQKQQAPGRLVAARIQALEGVDLNDSCPDFTPTNTGGGGRCLVWCEREIEDH